VFTFQILGMIFSGINATLYWALVADTADFQEWKFRVRTTGVVFSATTCAQKAGMGIGAAMAGWLLTMFGYVANTEQSVESLRGILLLNSLIPAAGLLILAALFSLYGLNENICKTMREELAQRREQQKPAPTKAQAEETAGAGSLVNA
jgi:glycoside/pentoside/hexuronide:cation symporter, GPH family